MTFRLLVINPGLTSTKIAVYDDEQPLFLETLRHPSQEIAAFPHILDQYDFRLKAVLGLLEGKQIPLDSLSAVVGRGGVLRPIPSGTYQVNDKMVGELSNRNKEREHASNLGGLLARDIADRAGVPALT